VVLTSTRERESSGASTGKRTDGITSVGACGSSLGFAGTGGGTVGGLATSRSILVGVERLSGSGSGTFRLGVAAGPGRVTPGSAGGLGLRSGAPPAPTGAIDGGFGRGGSGIGGVIEGGFARGGSGIGGVIDGGFGRGGSGIGGVIDGAFARARSGASG